MSSEETIDPVPSTPGMALLHPDLRLSVEYVRLDTVTAAGRRVRVPE
jgi:hypothetical protein